MNQLPLSKRVLIIAGEASGDQQGAKLVSETLKLDPNVQFFGIGSHNMQAAGVNIIIDAGPMAVIGAIEVLSHFKHIFHAWRTIRRIIKTSPPDLLILIDYPDFNLRIAKLAKQANIKVLYYISPQIWAWKRGRIKIIKERVNKMLVVFPFEETIYQQAHIPVAFVGHPLVDDAYARMTKTESLEKFNIKANRKIIGLLPGSRKGEIKRLLPVILQTAQLLKKSYIEVEFLLPLASTLTENDLKPYLTGINFEIKIIPNQFYDVMQLCDAAIVTSGTATLQTALMGVPMTIIYKVNPITYFLAKRVIKIDYIGLCNIVAGELIAKEFIQHEANPINIAKEISAILDNRSYRNEIMKKLNGVKTKLGKSGGSIKAAEEVIALLNTPRN